MKRKRWDWCVLLLVLLLAPAHAQDTSVKQPVTIRWSVMLGIGSNAEQIETERKLVDEFNASQTNIFIEFDCGCFGSSGTDKLETLIAAGTPPDILGPTSIRGSNQFAGEWLDLQPLVDETGYDLSLYPPHLIDAYRSSSGLLSLPFGIYPGVLFYNADMFDAAGLNYPPTVPGDPYIMPDGRAVPWDYDTVAVIAQRLTLDANGHTADSPDFDPETIVQYGFTHQWETLTSDFQTFGAGPLINDGQVDIPDNWRAQVRWMQDGIWTHHFMPSIHEDDIFLPNLFDSGRVAMTRSMLWFTCCVDTLSARWDLAIPPAYNGQIYAPMEFSSFYIHKDTPHPREAFIVLQYLLGAAAPRLLDLYDMFPARPDLYDEALAHKAAQFPQVQNWNVVRANILLAPLPNQDFGVPDPDQASRLFDEFLRTLQSPQGRHMDVDAALDQLEVDLQALIDKER